MAEVALRQVVKKYGDVEAVRTIDLDIPNNEFVVLVGPRAAASRRRCG
jgi:multiple sugar transport system ATP-binding protein